MGYLPLGRRCNGIADNYPAPPNLFKDPYIHTSLPIQQITSSHFTHPPTHPNTVHQPHQTTSPLLPEHPDTKNVHPPPHPPHSLRAHHAIHIPNPTLPPRGRGPPILPRPAPRSPAPPPRKMFLARPHEDAQDVRGGACALG